MHSFLFSFLFALLLILPTMAAVNTESNDARLSKLEAHIKENRPLLDTVNHFSAKEFADLFTRSNELFMIVDCRSEAAYKASHIPNAMTLDEFHERISDKRAKVIRTVFYGNLGEDVVDIVKKEAEDGVKAYNLEGGLMGWSHYCRYIDDENGDMATSMVVPSENQQWQKDTLKPLFE